MSKFLSELEISLTDNDSIWRIDEPLIYQSSLLNCIITVPKGFLSDLASVPRVPIAYWFWGGRVHRESVLHDYLFCKNSIPVVPFSTANNVFKEAMIYRNKPWYVTHFMYAGVCAGGYFSYHKRLVEDSL